MRAVRKARCRGREVVRGGVAVSGGLALLVGALSVGPALGGCGIPAVRYRTQVAENARLRDQLGAASNDLARARARIRYLSTRPKTTCPPIPAAPPVRIDEDPAPPPAATCQQKAAFYQRLWKRAQATLARHLAHERARIRLMRKRIATSLSSCQLGYEFYRGRCVKRCPRAMVRYASGKCGYPMN